MLFKIALVLAVVNFNLIQPVFAGTEPSFLENYKNIERHVVLPEIGGNLSGITYNYDSDTFFLIQNNYGQVFEYNKDFSKMLRRIVMKNLIDKDTEDIVYLGKNKFALVTEKNQIVIFNLDKNQTEVDMSVSKDDVQVLQLTAPGKDNQGLEGLCFTMRGSQGRGTFYSVQENHPKKLYSVPYPVTSSDLLKSSQVKFSEPFNTDKLMKHIMSDLSGCTFNDKYNHLLVLSHESSKLMELTTFGMVVSTLNIPAVASQYEGVTIDAENRLVLVSEPNSVVILNPIK